MNQKFIRNRRRALKNDHTVKKNKALMKRVAEWRKKHDKPVHPAPQEIQKKA